jgi:1,4-alpha-glucan branching enzyme
VVDDSVQNMIAFTRYDSEGNSIIAVLNFSRVNRICYEIGVEHPGVYQTVFNSADKKYGGNGQTGKTMETIEKSIHNQRYALVLDLEGNSAIFIKKIKEKK